MLQKDLRLSSIDDTMPPLARFYITAVKKVYGITITVGKSKWSRFAVFEDDLRELHIPEKEYAYTVLTILKQWCKSKHFSSVPVNVFTGAWALSKFMRVWKSDTVVIHEQSSDEELLYSEVMVAKLYISTLLQRYVRLSEIVESCKDVLSPSWYEMYIEKDKHRNKFVKLAIEMLCEEYGISQDAVETYSDIARLLIS